MAQTTSHVPKFGNWKSDENVPYTAYFNNARKNKTDRKMNPSDPQESPDMFTNNHPRAAVGGDPQRMQPENGRHKSWEDEDFRKLTESPIHQNRVVQRVTDSPLRGDGRNSPLHLHGGASSPLHPQSQARGGGKASGVSSPLWERKGLSEGGSHGSTPGRSRLRPVTRGDETSDKSAAVPRFGDWNEADPASAEGYTHIFNNIREERHNVAGMGPAVQTESYSNGRSENAKKSCCCFPWSGK